MALFVDPGRTREKIDQVVNLWKERCLLGDGSLLFEDRSVWSFANLQEFRERFLAGAIYGTGENFEEKLEKQLEDASADARWRRQYRARVGKRSGMARAIRPRSATPGSPSRTSSSA